MNILRQESVTFHKDLLIEAYIIFGCQNQWRWCLFHLKNSRASYAIIILINDLIN